MDMSFGDVMMRDDLGGVAGSPARLDLPHDDGPVLIPSPMNRRHTVALDAEGDVCFPQDGMSEIAEEDHRPRPGSVLRRSRRRRGRWPDLSFLEEFSRFEKESRGGERRAKRITEPHLINGRLRTVHKNWARAEEDAPYRFTYFNEELESTIHSHTLSELVQPGGTFRELFIPDPPLLSDSEDDAEDEPEAGLHGGSINFSQNGDSKVHTREPSLADTNATARPDSRREGALSPPPVTEASRGSREGSGTATPSADPKSPLGLKSPPTVQEKPVKLPKYGDRPVWWLDVLSPTQEEMWAISKAFGIHPLTAEDIMMQEAREKVELFRHYYFVNYRSFDQDQESADYMEPVNMFAVIFREGVISFHFSMTPHPANVRRRIRQLQDYMILSSDWISYALIDDITDAFVPLIQNIENEVDDIDDVILQLHSAADRAAQESGDPRAKKPAAVVEQVPTGGDMLRRVGDCRKTVMGLYRLLSNKADVIKGFAKRCNEHWEVAPRSEIGLYLGDIQDHIVTMTANLGHYEKILARSHGNYLAQINIRMNERAEQTADTLGRLTVLGTIVLPMNIITGLWGMNVWVPGQEFEGDLNWFMWITAGLLLFGVGCYLLAKRVYKIV
jgi:magnesium transporter